MWCHRAPTIYPIKYTHVLLWFVLLRLWNLFWYYAFIHIPHSYLTDTGQSQYCLNVSKVTRKDTSNIYRRLTTTKHQKVHDDVIKWKHFPRNWPFVRGIHRSPVNSPHKGQWRGALMFTLICARINGWVNTREAGDLRRYRPHYDVIVMEYRIHTSLGVLFCYAKLCIAFWY